MSFKVLKPVRGKNVEFSGISAAAISPDGRHVTTCDGKSFHESLIGYDNRLPLPNPDGEKAVYQGVIYNSSGTMIFAYESSGVLVWGSASGVLLRKINCEVKDRPLLSEDGTKLLTLGEKTLQIWDVESGKNLVSVPLDSARAEVVAVNKTASRIVIDMEYQNVEEIKKPDGGVIRNVSNIKNILKIIDIENLAKPRFVQNELLEQRPSSVRFDPGTGDLLFVANKSLARLAKDGQVTVAPLPTGPNALNRAHISDSCKLIVVPVDRNRLTVLDTSTQKTNVFSVGESENIDIVKISKDDRCVVFSTDAHVIYVGDVRSGKIIRTIKGCVSKINELIVCGNSDVVFSVEEGEASWKRVAKVWDLKNESLKYYPVAEANEFEKISFVYEGVGASFQKFNNGFAVYYNENARLPRRVASIECSFDKMYSVLVFDGGDLLVWDKEKKESVVLFKGEVEQFSDNPDVKFSRDGSMFLYRSGNNVKIVRSIDGQFLAIIDVSGLFPTGPIFSPDGKSVVAGLRNKNAVVFWDVFTGKVAKETAMQSNLPANKIVVKKTQPTVSKAVSGQSDSVRISWLDKVQFDSQGNFLMVSTKDFKLQIWDAAGGKLISVMKGHTQEIVSFCISGDGRRAASLGKDRTIRVWDVFSGAEMIRLQLPDKLSPDQSSVEFSENGEDLFVARGRMNDSVRFPSK